MVMVTCKMLFSDIIRLFNRIATFVYEFECGSMCIYGWRTQVNNTKHNLWDPLFKLSLIYFY